MPTDKKIETEEETKEESKVEEIILTRRQRIIAARKLNLQRKRRQKLPPVLR
tara:strand:- start:511 stop:666 length:156 start_codon:yes stop_codon:yes gene_type:complete